MDVNIIPKAFNIQYFLPSYICFWHLLQSYSVGFSLVRKLLSCHRKLFPSWHKLLLPDDCSLKLLQFGYKLSQRSITSRVNDLRNPFSVVSLGRNVVVHLQLSNASKTSPLWIMRNIGNLALRNRWLKGLPGSFLPGKIEAFLPNGKFDGFWKKVHVLVEKHTKTNA